MVLINSHQNSKQPLNHQKIHNWDEAIKIRRFLSLFWGEDPIKNKKTSFSGF